MANVRAAFSFDDFEDPLCRCRRAEVAAPAVSGHEAVAAHGEFFADKVHEPLPEEESEITQRVIDEIFTVTLPLGIEPANSGETLTEMCSAVSWPKVTLEADSLRPTFEVSFETLRPSVRRGQRS